MREGCSGLQLLARPALRTEQVQHAVAGAAARPDSCVRPNALQADEAHVRAALAGQDALAQPADALAVHLQALHRVRCIACHT